MTAVDIRIGNGFDVHAFGDGDHVMLGGVRVAHERGVRAHSDGDVVVHALCDAMLGALALGDIGRHFPPSDPQWKGADSLVAVFSNYARDVVDAADPDAEGVGELLGGEGRYLTAIATDKPLYKAGDVVDKNKAFLGQRCRTLGIEVVRASTVRDREDGTEWLSQTWWLSDIARADEDPDRVRCVISAIFRRPWASNTFCSCSCLGSVWSSALFVTDSSVKPLLDRSWRTISNTALANSSRLA